MGSQPTTIATGIGWLTENPGAEWIARLRSVVEGRTNIVAMLAGRSSIRDILAFPKNQNGRDLMADCPSPVAPKQLRDLRIRLVEDEPKPKA